MDFGEFFLGYALTRLLDWAWKKYGRPLWSQQKPKLQAWAKRCVLRRKRAYKFRKRKFR